MKGFVQYIALVLVAILSILAGIAGLVLPILPGVLLILVGVVLLSTLNTKVEVWLHSITKKYPPVHKVALELKTFINRIMGKK